MSKNKYLSLLLHLIGFCLSYLKSKSDINEQSAKLLHSKGMYPSVVHCSYYSCVQLMKHVLHFTMGVAIDAFDDEVRKSEKGSHEVLINRINFYLRDLHLDYKPFNESIVALKKLRKKADYDNAMIDVIISDESIRLAIKTTKYLKEKIRI